MVYIFLPFETVLNKKISNFVTYIKNNAVILHVLYGDGWMENPKKLADISFTISINVLCRQNLIHLLCCIIYSGSGGGAVG